MGSKVALEFHMEALVSAKCSHLAFQVGQADMSTKDGDRQEGPFQNPASSCYTQDDGNSLTSKL